MIDIEAEVFDYMYRKLIEEFEGINVVSISTISEPKFPTVSIEEINNITYTSTLDSSGKEKHATVGYEVNVYTNSISGKRTQAKKIINFVDNEFDTLGFTRTSYEPVTLDDGTIFRIVARYNAVVSDNGVIYRG